ncbi:MAG: hypothetical protein JSW27_00320, partial [Phycisphaerales bacterium]
MSWSVRTFSVCLMLSVVAGGLSSRAAGRVGIVADPSLDRPAAYGLERLADALQGKGCEVQRLASTQVDSPGLDVLVLAGQSVDRGAASDMLKTLNVPLPEGPEALVVRRTVMEGKPAVILCGSDARGLMYAALDAADRVLWSQEDGDPLAHVRDAQERPYVLERAVSTYTMQRAYFESRLYDETYWQRYFDMLARSRINGFVVVFGYENGGFMAPPYPYFFDMAEFPQVRLVGITAEQQRRNTA